MDIQINPASAAILIGMVIFAIATANIKKLAKYFRGFLSKIFGDKSDEVTKAVASALMEFAEELKKQEVNGDVNIVTNKQIEESLRRKLQEGGKNENS